MRNATIGAAVLATLGCLAGSAGASPLVPGSVNWPVVAEPDPVGGAVVALTVSPFAGPKFSGTLTSTVIAGDPSNPFGGLTFTYLLQNDVTSIDEISRMTINDFTGFLTDVSYQIPPAGLAPAYVDRNIAGDVIGFSFQGAPFGQGSLLPGQTSALLVVQTSSTVFNSTFVSAIDGGVAMAPSFAPLPEPATLSLLAMGGLAMLRRRRK